MTYHIDIQNTIETPLPIDETLLNLWVSRVLERHMPDAELTLRIVDEKEITQLNTVYRKQAKPTNVLAFPSDIPDVVILECPLLGDMIICPSVLEQESLTLNQPLIAHWAHIVIHGVLHLLGYDHMEDEETQKMQAEEITILSNLGYANPYNTEDLDIEKI